MDIETVTEKVEKVSEGTRRRSVSTAMPPGSC